MRSQNMVRLRSKVFLLIGGCLAVGLAGFLAYVCHQAPTKTTVRIIYTRNVPANFSGSSVSVISRPVHGLRVVPDGSLLAFYWSNLIGGRVTSIPIKTLFPDGVLIELQNHRWSWGAQRIEEATAELPSVTPGHAFNANFNIKDTDSFVPEEKVSPCPTTSCSGVVVRPHRLECDDTDQRLRLSTYSAIRRGQDNVVTVDTSPLPILVPDNPNHKYFQGMNGLCYSAFGPYEENVVASELPPEGGTLSYSIEDETTAAPYPQPDALRVAAQVIDDDNRRQVPSQCAEWTGELAKTCWRAYEALPASACADAWPITLDTKRRVLHFSRPRKLGLDCHLLLAVRPPRETPRTPSHSGSKPGRRRRP